MIDLDSPDQFLPTILSDVTTDGRMHSLFYVTEQGGGRHSLGSVTRINERWVFRPYRNQHFDTDELWLVMRYITELTYKDLKTETAT